MCLVLDNKLIITLVCDQINNNLTIVIIIMCRCSGDYQFVSLSFHTRPVCCVIFLVICCLFRCTICSPIRIKNEIVDDTVQSYLMSFGYMPKTSDGAFALRTEESIRDAIKDMQQFAGIPVTGRLDDKTMKLLNTPRCGLPDKNIQTSGRRKRFTLHGQKWPYTNLTWSLRSKNFRQPDPYEVRYVITKAFEVWSRHSKLTFTEVDSDRADILIYFYRGDHGDSFPFDGKGVILAHAFFPNGGRTIDVHFDADETWTTRANSDEGTNLFNVAAHEFGHSLGLSHSSIDGALMYPWYKEMENGFDYELPEDDKLAIQTLYGARVDRAWAKIPKYNPQPTTTTTTTTTTTRPTTTQRVYPTRPVEHYPKPSDPRYPNGGRHPHYPHKPKKPMHPEKKPPHYPKYPYNPERKYPNVPRTTPEHHTPRYNNRYPERTPENPHHHHPDGRYPGRTPDGRYPERTPEPSFPSRRHHNYPAKESPSKPPPDTCDTSYDSVAVIRREVFIFKDAYFWRIGDKGLLPDYPSEIIRLWPSLPHNLTHVDAVYERPDNKIVFFIGNLFYVFSGNRLEHGYPRPLTDLGLPATLRKIDGAMIWGYNGKTYFYSGSMYWKFDEQTREVELDYPRDMSMWKGVGTDIDAVFQWKDGRTYFFKGKGFWKFNDQLMRVEHEEQKPSAPFWMGCTHNLEGSNVGQKLPYNHQPTSKSPKITSSFLLIISFYLFSHFLYY